MRLLDLSQCYTHSYCPYIDTDDLQQMTPVCIISSVVVGLGPPHVKCNVKYMYNLVLNSTTLLVLFIYPLVSDYKWILSLSTQVLKYSGT